MSITVRTNHHNRPLLYDNEVPEKVFETDLDWIENREDETYLHYRGRYYALSEFLQVDKNHPLYPLGYHGYHGDSYFSGVAIKLDDTGESYQVALILS
jgi:hypothetical protein